MSPPSETKSIKVGLGNKVRIEKRNGISVYCDFSYERIIACKAIYMPSPHSAGLTDINFFYFDTRMGSINEVNE